MGRPYGSRTILIICGALVILLGALAAVQYRWSARVAAADAQREKEHLQAAATLFAEEFNTAAAQAVTFLQNDGAAAVKSGSPLVGAPKLLGDLYYDDIAPDGNRKVEKLGADGLFVPAPLPTWAEKAPCASVLIAQPPALVTPLYDSATENEHGEKTIRIVRNIHQRSGRCFIASIDQAWLRENLFPQLIGRSFGPTLQNEYDFTVLARGQPVYGERRQPDLVRPFFSITPGDLGIGMPRLNAGEHAVGQAIMVQRVESAVITAHISGDALGFSPLIGPGSWEPGKEYPWRQRSSRRVGEICCSVWP
jgi:two-component system, OmpR family, sensor histidine kinase SenX3